MNLEREGVANHVYAIELAKAIHGAVTPGVQLDAMNKPPVQKVSQLFDDLAIKSHQDKQLYGWVDKEMYRAATDAVYGSGNSFKYPEILEAFGTSTVNVI